jgi:signal peptidase I
VNVTTERFVVEGASMQPLFKNGQFLIISRFHYVWHDPQRNDIVVFRAPLNNEQVFIKRILGLPYEAVEIRDTQVYINGRLLPEPYLRESCTPAHCADGFWQLGEAEYFVMGDNRNHSSDSRTFGAINRMQIVGEAVIRYWPISDLAWIHQIGRFDD